VPARPGALPSNPLMLRTMAEQAFSRTAGAPLVGGNAVRVLRDATENYPVWEAAIARARHTVHVEMYIFHRDAVGRRYVDLLTRKARDGVTVRVLYDWFGTGVGPALGLFSPLMAAGGTVRPFNPPSLTAALGWVRRDHRKLITVDAEVAFIGGLCIGQAWEGRPDLGQEPWRDTAVEIMGPAVEEAEQAFAESWRLASDNPCESLPMAPSGAPAGSVNLRLIPTDPFTANLLRLDLLVTTLARRSLWISDAYFIGTGPYLEALRRAAADGVDVRLLLPQDSDVAWTVSISRSLYRPLLEAGVRIFEWSGTMMHAKTAVADGRWARIGSTNLNLTSWIGNWELDVAIEDEGVARTLESHFETDLERCTEIVLGTYRGRARLRARREAGAARAAPRRVRSSRRVVRTVTGVGRSVSAAITGNRPVEDFELAPLIAVGAMLVGVALLGLLAPRALAWPIAILAGWTATTMVVEAWALWRKSRQTRAPDRERRDPEPSTRHPEPEPRTEHPEP
jgi:phosphatidylserine/phosphatidylglycerophosphate/cardiolipin synthase-like enzyme